MPDPIALWHSEHANFATLLDLLERELELVCKGDSPDYALMQDIIFYMTHYPDVFHHPKEDLAFAKIKEREIAARRIVDELVEQHARLHEGGHTLGQAIDDVVNGSIVSRDHVEACARTYIDNFRRHMHTEETAILPLAARLLRDDDWAAIDAAIRQIDDPLFGKKGEARYAALRRELGAPSERAHTPG